MEIVVYADILFATNFLMDTVILYFTSFLTRTPYKIWKFTLCAAFLAAYGTIAFYPVFDMLATLPVQLAVSAVAISFFGIKSGFFRRYIVFWAVSVVLGGAVFAVIMSSDIGTALNGVAKNGNIYLEADLRVICSGIALSYFLIIFTKKICARNFSKDKILIPFSLRLCGKNYRITSLIDTGCELTVPLTGEGVLLISREALKNIHLPEPYLNLTISTASGTDIVPIYYPEKIECLSKSYNLSRIPPVGIVSKTFTKDGLYNSILNPIILKENTEKRYYNEKIFHRSVQGTDRKTQQADCRRSSLYRRR